MSTVAVIAPIAESSPRRLARIAGAFYLLTFVTGSAALVVRGRLGAAAAPPARGPPLAGAPRPPRRPPRRRLQQRGAAALLRPLQAGEPASLPARCRGEPHRSR